MLTLAMPEWAIGLLVVLFVVVSIMMMLVVLIQRPQGGGLSEAFGASSGSNTTAFGAKTGDALTTATIIIFLMFIGFAIGLNYAVRPPRPTAQQAATVQSPEDAPFTATSIDAETGLPGAPVQLEKIDAPPGFENAPPPPPAGEEGSTFVVPESGSAQPQTPPTEEAPGR